MADAKVNATNEELEALEVFKLLIRDARGRADFISASDKAATVNARKGSLTTADYNNLPEDVRQLLEDLTDEQLALLARIDATFVDAGLFVSRNPRPLMVH